MPIVGDNTGDDFPGFTDLELTEGSPTTNQSADAEYYVSTYASSDRRFTLLRADGLSSISGPVTVSSAILYQYHINTANSGASNVIRLRRCLRTFVYAEATWNIFSTAGGNWTGAGCQSDGNDRSATTTVDFSPGTTTGSYKSCTSAQLATDSENKINGTYANDGWLQSRSSETTYDTYYDQFRGSKATDGERPYLSLTYTAGGVSLYQRSLGRGIGRGIARGL